ncbi:MAG: S41 family peptidase [Methylacidiphilales bacterium]|nr:S41 family peptidase [Candidatus Methylacidiphilales bacterium]
MFALFSKNRFHIISGIIGFTLAVILFVVFEVFASKNQNNPSGTTIPISQLKIFAEVFENIKQNYVDEVKDSVLMEGAIKGMLTELDPHSNYLSKKEFKELQISTRGEFGGLGIQVTMEDGLVKVIAPIDDTPAQRAGVKSGDLIIKLDETPVKGLTLDQAIDIMRGAPGTPISLTMIRKGQEPFRLNLIRAIISVASVKSRRLSNNIVYLRISQFQEKTARDVENEFNKQVKKSKEPVEGLVLDLRSNPGGLLDAAKEISDHFLESGLVVFTKTRNGISDSYQAQGKDIAKGVPIVVLVDGGSASASEIVAGALQDNRRAVIAGLRTFGKGSVQNLHGLEDGGAIKLTIARYYTPSGNSIQEKGIEPDIQLEYLDIKKNERNTLLDLREADLQNHLVNEENKKTDKSLPQDDTDSAFQKSLPENDFMLYQAINLVQGMAATKKQKTALRQDQLK